MTPLPDGEWVHLTATFDYADGTGTSPTNPRGIKIGGSFPQDGTERYPCNCRMDGLMFLDDAASASEVARQYRRLLR